MENKVIQDRLTLLRAKMQEEGIDFYMMPTADFHNSEYVNDYFKVREYFSNFTGSNGTLLVWKDGAGLWTDGRYFIQAEAELEGTGVELFRMLQEGVPTIEEFLEQNMQQGQTLGFDGRVIAVMDGKKYEKVLAKAQIGIAYEKDLADSIWTDRPDFPAGKVTVLDEKIAGRSVEEKLTQTREKMAKDGANALLLTKLDDLMWLFNIRGCDVECNPVAMSYAYITEDTATLFIQQKALDTQVSEYLTAHHINVKEYDTVVDFLKSLPAGNAILVDNRYCSYTLYKTLQKNQQLIEGKNPTELLKAIKNPVEQARMQEIFLKDSVAVTKFIYWLKTHVGKEKITEVTAADYLEQKRREIPEFLDLSFPTIAGYKSNAAMMHYEATPENCATLEPEGMLLVDSGGQYLEGTTDITRTYALGPLTEKEKEYYTIVAAAMLKVSTMKFLHGCRGINLDYTIREAFWKRGLDFAHGTGHGVGYLSNVHERPNGLRWKVVPERQDSAVIEPGMICSDEPGLYFAGDFGTRTENLILCVEDEKNEYGQFLKFEFLTKAPIDLEALDTRFMDDADIERLNTYHKDVYETISPYMNEEEKEWLKHVTREISR